MSTPGSAPATKEDFDILLQRITEQQVEAEARFTHSLELTKKELREESDKREKSLQEKVSAVSDKTEVKWKREGNRRQFEFNQLSYFSMICLSL